MLQKIPISINAIRLSFPFTKEPWKEFQFPKKKKKEKKSSTTVFNIDDNNKCFLSSKSAY